MNLVLLPVVAPFIISPLLLYLSTRARRLLVLLYLAVMILVAVYILSGVELGEMTLFTSTFIQDSGMAPLYFAEHPYGKIAAFGFLLVGALALLYGLEVMKASEQAISIMAMGAAVGIAFSGNFITMFIFWELLTVTTAALIIINGASYSLRMGYRFLLIHLGGGLLLFMGIMQHYAASGSLLVTIPEAGLPFFILGIGFKAVFLPLHVWLPMGYPAASFTASVVLAGLTTKVGVYAVARILPPSEIISLMGAFMALFGATYALLQGNLRRLLSYHIISQVGFMVAGVGIGLPMAVDGGLLHVVNHMLYKALLFMSAGALIFTTGQEDIHDLNEHDTLIKSPIWLGVPIAPIGALIGALAIAGTPLFNGYVSKYLLKKGLYGIEPVATLLMIAGVGTSLSFCKFVYFGFLKGRARINRDVTLSMWMAIVLVSTLCIVLGIWPQLLTQLLPHSSSLAVYSLQGAWDASKIILTGILIFVFIARILLKGIHLPDWFSVEQLIYRPMLQVLFSAYTFIGRVVETMVDGLLVRSLNPMGVVSQKVSIWDHTMDVRFFQPVLQSMMRFAAAWSDFDNQTVKIIAVSVAKSSRIIRDGIYEGWLRMINSLFRNWRSIAATLFFFMIKVDFDSKSDAPSKKFSMMNLDINFVVIILILTVAMGLGFLVLIPL